MLRFSHDCDNGHFVEPKWPEWVFPQLTTAAIFVVFNRPVSDLQHPSKDRPWCEIPNIFQWLTA
jgi:hypothetical protein